MRRTSKTRSLRILLADDHELVRRGIRGVLNAERKWRVVAEAGDGLQAIEKARVLQPDVVVLDVDMPRLNGLEATPKIREAVPRVKIIILTLHESGALVRRVLEAGAHGVVLKSDLAERLVTALHEISHTQPFLTAKAADMVRNLPENEDDPQPATSSHKHPTAREVQVIRLLTAGKANKEVADALGISVRTAEAHRARVMRKLGFRSFADLVHYALRSGIAASPSGNGMRS